MIAIPSFDDAALPMPDQSWKRWSDLLQRRCGLALRDAQLSVLAGIIEARKKARGLVSDDDYFYLLATEAEGEAEWVEVVDRLVSHETSFFRHAASFDALRHSLLPELRRRSDRGHVTLCCAGCSTGEEAYSMAMVAMDERAREREFIVWGSDISRRSIEAARTARYTERAVARVPAEFRQYFRRAPGHPPAYDVVDEVRGRVRFLAVNLFGSGGVFLNYDVIFCQNVLIYFAPAAVPRLISLLAARLTDGGFLVLGPGEAPLECPAGLEVANFPGVRAFRRVGWNLREVRP
jgi:type IV pilus assembly protein PilK